MNIKVYKTNEIAPQSWLSITEGFNESFEQIKTAEDFLTYYCNTILNYSYHALAFDDNGDLVGSTTIIPYTYSVVGEKILFGLSGGTFVKKAYRSDIFILQDMVSALNVFCRKEGMKIFYGVPNKNSFSYFIQFLDFTLLMDLNYYALPLKIGNVISATGRPLVNAASWLFCTFTICLNQVLSVFYNSKATESKVAIEFDDNFIITRFNEGYEIINKNKLFVAYKNVIEDGVRTIYLIEYRENGIRSYRALSLALSQIKKREVADIILFIGTIHHKQLNLFKVPVKKHPKRLPLTFYVLDPSDAILKEILSKSENWDFSLVNFDVR